MRRTTATVLFTDLVGSTELRGRLGDEAADELRRKHDQLLAEAVDANNGQVVKGLGDGIMATFAGAADAVAAAVAIQQAVDRLNRSGKAPVPLAVRVGLSAGDVASEANDVHGTPVVEASRLCGAAVGGEILASEIVRWLGGAQGAPSLVPVGSLELKGLAEPVPAVRVEWEPAPASTIPMPALLTDVGRIFVGRDAELERLAQLWKEAAAGERRIALLAGEPGVGKTRLAAELAIRVHEDGGVALAGRCDEDLGVPYQPFVEALRHFLDHAPPAEAKERLGRYGGELARLVPEVLDRVAGLPRPLQSDPETERYRLFDAVSGWLATASADEPVLLVLDDLQWAAKPTLLLLRHVVRSPVPARLLMIGTYRDTELDHDHPLVEVLADLRRQPGVERFSLLGLEQTGVAAFVEHASGQSLDDDALALARAIYLETEGNPFFVREVLRHLTETEGLVRHGDGWSTRLIEEVGIPEGVRDVVGRRLARLSGNANEILRVAAVVGAEFEPDVVRAAGGFDEESLIRSLEEAAAARLVIESDGGRYRFAHALVRDTLYGALSVVRRVALHRRVGEAIESLHAGRLDDHLPALAHHWAGASAPATATAKAVDYAAQAGDRALAQLAHDEAVTYYLQALGLLALAEVSKDDARRGQLLISLGEAQRRAGDPAYRRTLLEAAELAQQRQDPDALARAALANYRGFWSATGSVDAERVAILEAALQSAGPGATRARLLANLGAELHYAGNEQRRRALSDEALTMARQGDNPSTLAHVILARCSTIWEPATAMERLANTAELLAVADRLGDPALLAWTSIWRFVAAMELGDIEEADRSLNNAGRLATELGQPMLRWVAGYTKTSRVLLDGDLAEAERLAVQARQFGVGAGQPDAHAFFGVQRFLIRFDQGRLGELIGRIEASQLAGELPGTRAHVALAYCELDRHGDARRVFEPLAATLTELPVVAGWIQTVAISAIVCGQLQDRSRAVPLLELLTPYADRLVFTGLGCGGAVSHYLGLLTATLERFDEAENRFAEAEATHARIPAPVWLARTRLEWARMLLTRRASGDAGRARDLIGQALVSARELGLGKVERDAVALVQ
ncbi:MAG TPA: AAA family ATPase [Acidimicrobiia bacterium]|nr:AAA family ATPase [Acidimicrobiia bacterium]